MGREDGLTLTLFWIIGIGISQVNTLLSTEAISTSESCDAAWEPEQIDCMRRTLWIACVEGPKWGIITASVYVLYGMDMPINFIKHRILISNVRSYRPRIRLDTCACLANDSTDKGKTLVRSTNHNGQLDRPVNRTEYKTLVPMDGPDYNTCPQDQRISYLVTILWTRWPIVIGILAQYDAAQ